MNIFPITGESNSKRWGTSVILLIITSIGLLAAVLVIPKRISYMEIYTTSLFACFLAALADIYLDVKYNLFGYFKKGVDTEYLFIFIIIYPAVNILFLNFFPFHKSLYRKVLYILGWSAATLLFEYLSLFSNTFYYNGWKLWYSAILYPLIYILLLVNLMIIRKLNKTS